MNEATNAMDIENLEMSIDEAKTKIKRMEALERLEKNPDFKLLITDGFMESHAIRQVMLKSVPSIVSNENAMKQIDGQITAIGGLKQFVVGIYTEGMNAKEALQEDENTLAELQAEAVEQENVNG